MTPVGPNTVCEGQLAAPRLGWTLRYGYPVPAQADNSCAIGQKRAALERALALFSEAGKDGAESGGAGQEQFADVDLRFPRGQAPTAVVTGRGGDQSTEIAPSPPALSLAHSGSLLLAAAAEPGALVGVDVERLRSRDFDRIAAHMGWCPSADLLSADRQQMSEKLLFYRRWTLAESLYKALGKVNLDCFAQLERLATDAVADTDSDSGWRSRQVGAHRWNLRWSEVAPAGPSGHSDQAAQSVMVCVLCAGI